MYVTLPFEERIVEAQAPKRETRNPLTQERILEAALRYVDEHGLEALSMRKLGHDLGVEAMSLYNHVEGKEDILDGIADLALAEIELPPGDLEWKEYARRLAHSGWEVLLRHPHAVYVIVSRPTLGSSAARIVDSTLGVLRRAGFDTELAHHAWHVIQSHVIGYVLQEVTNPLHVEGKGHEYEHERGAEAEAFIARLAQQGFPHLAELAPFFAECHYDEEFDFGLEVILTGLEAKLQASRGGI